MWPCLHSRVDIRHRYRLARVGVCRAVRVGVQGPICPSAYTSPAPPAASFSSCSIAGVTRHGRLCVRSGSPCGRESSPSARLRPCMCLCLRPFGTCALLGFTCSARARFSLVRPRCKSVSHVFGKEVDFLFPASDVFTVKFAVLECTRSRVTCGPRAVAGCALLGRGVRCCGLQCFAR